MTIHAMPNFTIRSCGERGALLYLDANFVTMIPYGMTLIPCGDRLYCIDVKRSEHCDKCGQPLGSAKLRIADVTGIEFRDVGPG